MPSADGDQHAEFGVALGDGNTITGADIVQHHSRITKVSGTSTQHTPVRRTV